VLKFYGGSPDDEAGTQQLGKMIVREMNYHGSGCFYNGLGCICWKSHAVTLQGRYYSPGNRVSKFLVPYLQWPAERIFLKAGFDRAAINELMAAINELMAAINELMAADGIPVDWADVDNYMGDGSLKQPPAPAPREIREVAAAAAACTWQHPPLPLDGVTPAGTLTLESGEAVRAPAAPAAKGDRAGSAHGSSSDQAAAAQAAAAAAAKAAADAAVAAKAAANAAAATAKAAAAAAASAEAAAKVAAAAESAAVTATDGDGVDKNGPNWEPLG
jgi:hypothetical protein